MKPAGQHLKIAGVAGIDRDRISDMRIVGVVVYDNAWKAHACNHGFTFGPEFFASFCQGFSQPSVTWPEAKTRVICLKAKRAPAPLNQVFALYFTFHLPSPCRRKVKLSSPPQAVPMNIRSMGSVVAVFNCRPPVAVPD